MPIKQVHAFVTPKSEMRADLIRRAKAAWLESESQGAPDGTSGFVIHGGLDYIVLRQSGDVLGVYRVRSDNLMLRRMKRPPIMPKQSE